MAFQRELTAHLAQQPGDQSQFVGKGGVQQKVCGGLEALDIPRFAVQHPVPHGKGLGGAAAAGCGVPQGAAAQADILRIDDPAPVDAVFLPQTGVDAVDLVVRHKAGQLRVKGMDALHDAHTTLQIDGLHLGRALLGGKIVNGQLGLAGLAELAQALLDKGQIQRFKVFVVQRAVRHFGVVGSAFKKVVQTDHLCRGALLHQRLCQTVGAGGLAAGRRAGQHNDLCPGAAHLLGGILHPPGVAVLAQLRQRLRAAGCYVIEVYFNQSFRYPDRDHKTQPLLFSVPVPPQSAGYTRSDT